MKVSRNTLIFTLSIVAGSAVGFIGGSVIILLLWAIVGIGIGILSVGKKPAVINGSVFGFVAAFTFMVSGYQGQDAIMTRVFPFVVLGLVGAIYGILFSLIGHTTYRRIRHEK